MTDTSSLLHVLEGPLDSLELITGGGMGEWKIRPLAGDGSERRFFRVTSGRSNLVALVAAPSPSRRPEVSENDSYRLIGGHLFSCGIPVPQILWADVRRGLFILEDLGDCHLQKFACRPVHNKARLYHEMLKLLVNLHRRSLAGFKGDFCFDTTVYDAPFIYERELEYFRKAFLVGCLHEETDSEALRQDFEDLAQRAADVPQHLVFHRDFQSRNVMVHCGSLKLIDFQGMRFGPPTYDLASMLLDPYVDLDEGLQKRLAFLYWKSTRDLWDGNHARFRASYEAVRLCRSLQVLGAYGYLGIQRGKRQFLKYIPRAWDQLCFWIAGPVKGRYRRLERVLKSVNLRKRHMLEAFGRCR